MSLPAGESAVHNIFERNSQCKNIGFREIGAAEHAPSGDNCGHENVRRFHSADRSDRVDVGDSDSYAAKTEYVVKNIGHHVFRFYRSIWLAWNFLGGVMPERIAFGSAIFRSYV